MTGGPGRGAVVFDCDGVLADTQACWDAAFRATAGEFGVTLTSGQLHRLRGASVGAAAASLSAAVTGAVAAYARGLRPARPGPAQPPEVPGPARPAGARGVIARALHRELRAAIDGTRLRLLPGVREALQIVRGGPTAVASNGPEDVLRVVLGRLGILDAFDVVLSADDVASPKPAPDLYHLACARLQFDPACAAAVEDSPAGITAAHAAGLAVLAVGSGPGPSPASLTVATLADPAGLDWLRRHSRGGPWPATRAVVP